MKKTKTGQGWPLILSDIWHGEKSCTLIYHTKYKNLHGITGIGTYLFCHRSSISRIDLANLEKRFPTNFKIATLAFGPHYFLKYQDVAGIPDSDRPPINKNVASYFKEVLNEELVEKIYGNVLIVPRAMWSDE